MKQLLILYDLIMFLAFAWFPLAVLMDVATDVARHRYAMLLIEMYAGVGFAVLCAVLLRWWFKKPARATWFTLAVGISSLTPQYTYCYKLLVGGSLLAPEQMYPVALIFSVSYLLFIKGLRGLRHKQDPQNKQ